MDTLLNYKYTEKECKKLLKSITILCDSREQNNMHILNYFESKNISYETVCIDVGDYSFKLPKNADMGIMRDIFFDKKIAIERKNSLEELSNNFTKERTRFSNEFLRSKNINIKLLIEGGSFEKIFEHRYNTQFNEKSFTASLFAFQHRFNLDVNFISKTNSGRYIFLNCYYYLREFLKGG